MENVNPFTVHCPLSIVHSSKRISFFNKIQCCDYYLSERAPDSDISGSELLKMGIKIHIINYG